MQAIMLCLGRPDKENYDGVLRMLDVLFSCELDFAEKKAILENDFGIPMSQTVEGKVTDMCNLSKGVEGRGRVKGRAETLAGNIKSLMKSMGLSPERAMAMLDVPEAERQKYAVLLEKSEK